MKRTKKSKAQSLLNYAIFIGVLIFINVIGQYYYGRIDLTEEKRFTLTPATIKLLKNLDNDVTIEVLLDGDFPAGFKRLQKGTKEILQDFRAHSSFIHFSVLSCIVSRVYFAFKHPTLGSFVLGVNVTF